MILRLLRRWKAPPDIDPRDRPVYDENGVLIFTINLAAGTVVKPKGTPNAK